MYELLTHPLWIAACAGVLLWWVSVRVYYDFIYDHPEPTPKINTREYCREYLVEHLDHADEFLEELFSHCPCFGHEADPSFLENPDTWLDSFTSKINFLTRDFTELPKGFIHLNVPAPSPMVFADEVFSLLPWFSTSSENAITHPTQWIANRVALNLCEYNLKSFDFEKHGENVVKFTSMMYNFEPLRGGSKNARTTDPDELFKDMFKYTGFGALLKNKPPLKIGVPTKARMEHQWVLGASGSGKTTFLSAMLLADFVKVEKGEASVVLLDSKRDLIKSIENLAVFAKGGTCEGKLISIDVEDAARGFPVALNLMDLGAKDSDLDPVDKEAFRNSTLSMMNYFFESLLGSGSELTGRQSTVFNFVIQLMMEVDGANLDTLIDLLEPGGIKKFTEHMSKLPPDAQRYFETQFDNDNKTKGTKVELISRIYAIKSNTSLARLFSAKKTKLNLFEELSTGKVILINASKAILQDEVELFGRFMLAMILLAAERRQLIEKKERLPTYVYMDEAHDIIKNDTRLPTILSQARAYNVGMVISHQNLAQINNPKVISALMANTAIKCTGIIPLEDGKRLAGNMGIDLETIMNPPPYTFNISCSRVGAGTFATANISFDNAEGSFPFIFEKMTKNQYEAFLFDNRSKYSFTPEQPKPEQETTNAKVYDIGGIDYVPAEEDIGDLKDVADVDPLEGEGDFE